MLHDAPLKGAKASTEGEYSALATTDGEETAPTKETKIDQAGWMALVWSFAVSASFTVSPLAL